MNKEPDIIIYISIVEMWVLKKSSIATICFIPVICKEGIK